MDALEKITLGSPQSHKKLVSWVSWILRNISQGEHLSKQHLWYDLSAQHVEQIEVVDRMLLRKVLDTPISTPIKGIELELGIYSIGTIIKARRVAIIFFPQVIMK